MQAAPPTSAAAKETIASGTGRRPRKAAEYENTISVSHPMKVAPAAATKAVNGIPESSPALNDVVMAVDAANETVNSTTNAKTTRNVRVFLLGSANPRPRTACLRPTSCLGNLLT